MVHILNRLVVDCAREGRASALRRVLRSVDRDKAQTLMSVTAGRLSDAIIFEFGDYIIWGNYILSGGSHALDQYNRMIFQRGLSPVEELERVI